MPARHTISFAESAVADLEDIRAWYAGLGVPEVGEIIHPPFRIVYRLDDGRVRVVRVWRSERLLEVP